MSFGDFLKNTRLDRGLSQDELANLSNMTRAYISKVERSKENPPSEELLLRLAEALQIDPDLFIVKAGKIPTRFQDLIIQDASVFEYLKRKARKEKMSNDKAVL